MKHLKTVDILFYALLFILCAALLAGNALAEGEGNIIHKMRDQRAVCWFDENGKPLGTAELKMNPEDFPEMAKTLQADTEGKKLVPLVLEDRMIPMRDGLWLLAKYAWHSVRVLARGKPGRLGVIWRGFAEGCRFHPAAEGVNDNEVRPL